MGEPPPLPPNKNVSGELRCYKNKNGCINLQLIWNQDSMSKELDIEVEDQNQKDESHRLNNSEKLPDSWTHLQVWHVFWKETKVQALQL